jgi:hypothetical protein
MAYNPYTGEEDTSNNMFGVTNTNAANDFNTQVAENINYGTLPGAQDTFTPQWPMGATRNRGVQVFNKKYPNPTRAQFVDELESGNLGGATTGAFSKNVDELFRGTNLDAGFWTTEMGDVNPTLISPKGSFGGNIDINRSQLSEDALKALPKGFWRDDEARLSNDQYLDQIADNRYVKNPNYYSDATIVDNNEGLGVTSIDNPYQTYMHPYDEVDRWTADEDMQYQPDVKSNRLSFLTNPIKTGAGMVLSGLTKIPGAGRILDSFKPVSPELKAQVGAVTAADTSGLMAGQNMISHFGTNDPEQMILDRINKIKNRKADQTDFSRNLIKKLQRLADEANRAKHTATADLGGGWTRQNRPGGEATFTGPGGQTHQGWSNTDAGFAAAAESEGSLARGGYMRSRYNKGGRVGILAAF